MKYQKGLIFILLLLTQFSVYSQSERSLSEQASAAYEAKNYQRSAELFVAALEKEQDKSTLAYNAASGFALAGDKEKAFKYLVMAVDLGYMRANNVKTDADFNGLHKDARWEKIIKKAEGNNKKFEGFWESPTIATPYRENISETEKIAGLSKLWSEVKYNFSNFDLVPDVNWDALFLEYLPKVRETKSTLEYYRVLSEMVAKLRDGHSQAIYPQELLEKVYARPHMRSHLIEDKVIITNVFSDEVSAKGIEVGQEVLKINDLPVKEYAEKYVMPFERASTKQDLIKRTYNYGLFSGEEGKSLKLTLVDKNGKTFEAEVQRYYGADYRKLSNRKPQQPFEFKVLSGNIGYVELNTFNDKKTAEEFEKNFEAISKTDALILDIRQNGGGNSSIGWRILSMLTDKPFKTSRWHTREYKPTFRAWRRPEEKYGKTGSEFSADGSKHYKKPVILLTSSETFSAAEDFAVAYDAMERGLIIGEPTGGSSGQPLLFHLPGGGRARVTTKRDSYPDGKEFVGVGIIPDKIVQPTLKDLRNGRDTVLEAAKIEIKKIAGN